MYCPLSNFSDKPFYAQPKHHQNQWFRSAQYIVSLAISSTTSTHLFIIISIYVCPFRKKRILALRLWWDFDRIFFRLFNDDAFEYPITFHHNHDITEIIIMWRARHALNLFTFNMWQHKHSINFSYFFYKYILYYAYFSHGCYDLSPHVTRNLQIPGNSVLEMPRIRRAAQCSSLRSILFLLHNCYIIWVGMKRCLSPL